MLKIRLLRNIKAIVVIAKYVKAAQIIQGTSK